MKTESQALFAHRGMDSDCTARKLCRMPNNLREYREGAKLTLEKVASAIKCDVGTVSRHETGANNVTLAQLEDYATLYHTTPAHLIANKEQRKLLGEGQQPESGAPSGTAGESRTGKRRKSHVSPAGDTFRGKRRADRLQKTGTTGR